MARRRKLCLLVAVILSAGTATAQLSLAPVFTESMVLQRDAPVRLWGTAHPNRDVVVRFRDGAVTTTASPEGTWQARLPPSTAGGPFRLTVSSGDDTIRFEDVLVGDVWLASGQSNMAWPLRDALDGASAAAAADHPHIRFLPIPTGAAYEPVADVETAWQHCTPGTAASFSAVAYHFGRRLHDETGVPIGLINASYNGSRIEPWLDDVAIPSVLRALDPAAAALVERAVVQRDSFRFHAGEIVERWNAAARRIQQVEQQALSSEKSIRVDDADWPRLTTPMSARHAAASSVDGLMWLSREVEIPARWQGRDLGLIVGPLDQADVVWFDDQRVGNSGSFASMQFARNSSRIYRVPGDLVRAGTARVTIQKIRWIGLGRFYSPRPDSAMATGFWGTPDHPMYVAVAENKHDRVSLDGSWACWQDVSIPLRPTAVHQLPAMLYNAMIHPLVPLALRGVIWYQGEANVDDGGQYGPKLAALIESWRRVFRAPGLPFYAAQIAPYRHGRPQRVPALWESQRDVLDGTPHAGVVPTGDVGDIDDVHPRDKQTVGARLASLVLHREYGVTSAPVSGPLLDTVRFDAGRAIVTFRHAEALRDSDGGSVEHFEIAGADGRFHAATARIRGKTVVLSAPGVTQPASVHYAWADTSQPDLVNAAGWPAWPFRFPAGEP